ncbi:trypsin-like peptidase domain-containing protein [Moorena producens JHB]|uniref:Trypsin-like peptidase domain-containing protein n=1 Tax=Moorena producens (strain JHB) TaxID=1454205 RepID=A0A1D9FUM2_MOOP1|nr:trypsin-like peptidase domain-containing protein [Moorena producens]AOY79082.2 trypsin-like peptidase domain-containing protein [Moorena producens JHB]
MSIIRLFNQDRVVGIGFLVSEHYALTCAHVVAEALSITSTTQSCPEGEIKVDFPLLNSTDKFSARVVCWHPVSELDSEKAIEDIAVLKLDHLPASAHPTRLLLSENIATNPFKVLGCPRKVPFGVWATGVLSEQNAKQWFQLEDTKVTGYGIEAGFSGSPVWNEELQGVVGIVVAADTKRQTAKVAFMIPAQILVKAWSQLESIVIRTKEIEKRVKPLSSAKRKFLEQEKKDLEEKINDIPNQMRFLDPASSDYKNLKRRSDIYFEELEKIENQLFSF